MLGSFPVPLHLLLVSKVAPVIAIPCSMVSSGVPSFMEPTQLQSHPCNHGLLLKVVLPVSILCSRVCALDDLIIISMPMLFPTHCTPSVSPSHLDTYVRCAPTWPWCNLSSFILCHLRVISSSFQWINFVLHFIDRTVVPYLHLMCDLCLHF
jgi:hypothetical protein